MLRGSEIVREKGGEGRERGSGFFSNNEIFYSIDASA